MDGSLKKRIAASLGKAHQGQGRTFVLYEGEQVIPSVEAANLDGTCIVLARSWRPEGEALPDGIEGIPGYQRPDDWQQIQDAEDRAPGRLEMDGKTFWSK